MSVVLLSEVLVTDTHSRGFYAERKDGLTSEVCPGQVRQHSRPRPKPARRASLRERWDGRGHHLFARILSIHRVRDDGKEVDGLPYGPLARLGKNWELREVGECSKCPTGVVCRSTP